MWGTPRHKTLAAERSRFIPTYVGNTLELTIEILYPNKIDNELPKPCPRRG